MNTTSIIRDIKPKQKTRVQKQRGDTIITFCRLCQKEDLLAYWDAELEYYIYLSEKSCACEGS